jgi:hypothetical protein
MPELPLDPDVYVLYDRQFIRTPLGRGEGLRLHLASHGIRSKVIRLVDGPFDRVDLLGVVEPGAVQAILDQWENSERGRTDFTPRGRKRSRRGGSFGKAPMQPNAARGSGLV